MINLSLKYGGVYYISGKAVGANKNEKIYYIVYRKDGKLIDEKAGRQYQDDMTPARAAGLRAEKIEDLTPEQLTKLLKAIDKDTNFQAANMMKFALYTGMRRGEMFKLKWKDVNFNREFIKIKDPKGGPDQKIPLNDAARDLLKSHPKSRSQFVFPGRHGEQRTDI